MPRVRALASLQRSLPLLLLFGCGRGAIFGGLGGRSDSLGDWIFQPVGPKGDPPPSPLSGAPVTARATMSSPDEAGATEVRIDSPAVSLYLPPGARGCSCPNPRYRPHPMAEWARESDLLIRSAIPPERVVAVSAEPDIRIAVLDEAPARVLEVIETSAGAELARIDADGHGRPAGGQPGTKTRSAWNDWERVAFSFERFYCDYGGDEGVDFFVRRAADKTLVVVFADRGGTGRAPAHPDVLASVAVGDDSELAARGLAVWRTLVARTSGVDADAVAKKAVNVSTRVLRSGRSKVLEVDYVMKDGWVETERTDLFPLVIFSNRFDGRFGERDEIPLDVPLDADALAKVAATAAKAVRVAHLSTARIAFPSEAAAREAFKRAFGAAAAEDAELTRTEAGEPILTSEAPHENVLASCLARELSLTTGKARTVEVDCPKGDR